MRYGHHSLPQSAIKAKPYDQPSKTPGACSGCQSIRTTPIPGPGVFVGRSSFPDKDAFFSGCTAPDELMAEATWI